MNNKSLLNQIILNIRKDTGSTHIVVLPRNISKSYVKNILRRNQIEKTEVTNLDSFIFKLNKINQEKLNTSDISFLEKVFSESNTSFDKHNITNEIENILRILDKLFLEKNILLKSNIVSHETLLNEMQKNLLSKESKIFFEIFKIWLEKSKNLETYIGNYLKLLNSKPTNVDEIYFHIISIEEYEEIEKEWILKYLANNKLYKSIREKNIDSDTYIPKNINLYESFDFESQEDELEYVANDIKNIIKKNNECNIALINNDRYFARRLRAILERNDIKYNDFGGWLLSTSSFCSYVESIINYFIIADNYINLHNIIKSPFFSPNINRKSKIDFLNNVLLMHKNNISASVSNYIKNTNDDCFKFLHKLDSNDKNYNFREFRDFIIEKLNQCNSLDALENDSAAKEFIHSLNYLNKINYDKKIKHNYEIWHKKLLNFLESRTFKNLNESNIDYTDINHALLYNYDKIYVSSMSSKNFPKKITNHFNKNNIIYNDLSINSNLEQDEYIEDFLSLSNYTDSILITSHESNSKDILTKSKFKIYLDYFLEKKQNIKTESIKYSKNNKNSNTFILDKSFLNLTYKDIEYFNTCVYCFYIQKNLPRFQFSSIEENSMLFGSSIHSILDTFSRSIQIDSTKNDLIHNLAKASDNIFKKYYLFDNSPYEIQLWYKTIPKVVDYFYTDIDKKHDIISENIVQKKLPNGITLNGRYDLKYSVGSKNFITDYKTGSFVPTKTSVVDGINLQLPFYTILESNINFAEYLFINVSKNTINKMSFSYEELTYARDVINDATEKISQYVKDKTVLTIDEFSCGCENCEYFNSHNP